MSIYKCNVCDYSTTNKSNFSKHMKSNKHIMKIKTYKGKVTSISSDKKVEIEAKYSCEYCNISFNDRSNLYKHKHNTCKKNELLMFKKLTNIKEEEFKKEINTLKKKIEKLENQQKENKKNINELIDSITKIKRTNTKIT